MKVLMIGADRSVKGGVSAVVNNLYRAGLDKRVDLTYIGTVVDGSRARKLWKGIRALIRFLFCLPGADLVHVNMAADASCRRKMIFLRFAYLAKKKVVIHEHGGDFPGYYNLRCHRGQQRRIRRILGKADRFLVLSEEWKTFFSSLLPDVRMEVLQNAVFLPPEEKRDYGGHRVLFLGRLCREKGIGELLAAAPAVRAAVPDFELILGGFWERGSEDLQVRAAALAEFVYCPGWVGERRRTELFSSCSIFVLPTWFEGQPISLLEAMAAGLCPAVSAVGGIPQIMGTEAGFYGEAKTGVLFREKDEKALETVLIRLLQDEELQRQMGQNARERIRESYEIGRYVDRLTAIYEGVMG